jgi:AcrR family transcriptional regulator
MMTSVMSRYDITLTRDVAPCHHYTRIVSRWEPNAKGRLSDAAMELYAERGFEQTTVADIAERAGLTSRTFFRYFTDKREVLFAGAALLEEQLVTALETAPPSASPMQAVAAALDAAADMLGERRDFAQQRQAVISAHAELREREFIKMASLSAALADGLRRRGVPDPDADLAAEAGIVVFRVAFQRWVSESVDRGLDAIMRESLGQLKDLTAR